MKDNLPKIFADFIRHLSELKIDYVLIGGLALGYWTEERFTKDIDFTIQLDKNTWQSFNKKIEQDPNFIINTIAKDGDSDVPYLIRLTYQGYPFDLITSLTEYQNSLLAKATEVFFLDQRVKIAAPEDLIISKLIAHRDQDLIDVKNLVISCPDMDKDYIEKWVRLWDLKSYWQEIKDKLTNHHR